MSTTALVPRATVQQIVTRRSLAMDAITKAATAIQYAGEAIREAANCANAIIDQPGTGIRLVGQHDALPDLPARTIEETVEEARRSIDRWIWIQILKLSRAADHMDRTAVEEFKSELNKNPPEANFENIQATVERFVEDAGMIFARGIATAFSKLDRRFRSHDGFKVGSRIVLDYFMKRYSADLWSFHDFEGQALTLRDVERAFYVLDGREVPEYGTICDAIKAATPFEPAKFEVENDYFRVVVYKNANAHLWFKRKDLVGAVNRILADWYGEVVGDARQAESDPLKPRPGAVAPGFGFYPSPQPVVDRVESIVSNWLYRRDATALKALEPSAGSGAFCAMLKKLGIATTAVEIQAHLAEGLRDSGHCAEVLRADFLELIPDRKFDLIVMNPPFYRGLDIDHVAHALRFLTDDGLLVAVMSAGVEFAVSKKAVAFRELVDRMNGSWRDLPPGSFADSGTNVNTVMLAVSPSRRIWI